MIVFFFYPFLLHIPFNHNRNIYIKPLSKLLLYLIIGCSVLCFRSQFGLFFKENVFVGMLSHNLETVFLLALLPTSSAISAEI